jgi:RES domain-containing protein
VADTDELSSILAGLKGAPWKGTAFRVMLGEYPPDRENTQGARWNPPELAAIYTSLEAATAIAEVNYHLANQPRPIRRDVRKTLYELRIHLSAVLDITPALQKLEKLGLGRAQIFAADMRISQEIGRLVAWLGFDGLIAPSGRADGTNLVIYPSRASIELYSFEEVEQKMLPSGSFEP